MKIIRDKLTGEVKEKGVTEFGPPADQLSTPLTSAAAYSKRVEEKRQKMAEAKATKIQFGHAPPIPEGKLSPLVEAARASNMPQPDFGLPQVQAPTETQLEEWAPPKETTKPPKIQGVGSAYAVNQAISKGEVDGPVNMRQAKEMAAKEKAQKQGGGPISRETQRLLQMQHEAAPVPEEQNQPEPATPSNREALDAAERSLVERDPDDPLLFDFEAIRRAQIPLLKPERRKFIEDRLAPMNFEDLITKREITQEVEIVPGKFSVGYRTVREKENLWTLQYIYEVTGVSSAGYIEELTSVCKLVCAVRSINGKLLPDHRNNVGQPNEEVDRDKFQKKLDIIQGFPTHLVADLGVNFNWFSERVTKLFSVENLKNG